MPLFEITGDGLARREPTTFAELRMKERGDLQRLLRDDIGVIDTDLMILAEEFGDWEDAKRRIDLLAIDRSGHLVVIELKRTEDGGHMELQALRYAAMVSAMDFEQVVNVYAGHLAKHRPADESDARSELIEFLNTDGEADDEPQIPSAVRILLISSDFGRELTTAVLWLNQSYSMDIRCVRLIPYRIDERTLLDIQQVVPLPEAADYQVRLRRKVQEQERVRVRNRDFTRYHIIVDGTELSDENKRNAVRVMAQQLVGRGAPMAEVADAFPGSHVRMLDQVVSGADAIVEAARAADPRFDRTRWFLEHPFHADGKTYLLSKMWGLGTEAMLEKLQARFPEARVTFRAAD